MKKFFLLLLLFQSINSSHAQNIIHTADSLLLSAEYAKALDLIEKNLRNKSSEELVLLEDRKADALIHLGKFDEAEKLLKEIESKSNSDFLKGIVLTNYGSLFLNQGRNDRALEALQQALVAFENDGKSGSLEAAQALSNLGLVYNSTGKHAQAEEQLQMALNLRQHHLKSNHELIAASYNDLGLVYVEIDKDKALDHYEKALRIYEVLHGKEHPKIAIANANIGFIYNELELYGDAVNNFETSLKIWDKVYIQPHPTKAFVLLNLGNTYSSMGDQKAALGYYERSLKMYRESYGSKHPEISRVLNALGSIELAAAQYDKAIQYFHQAIVANVREFDDVNENSNPPLFNYYHGNVLLYSLQLKAQAFEARHFGKTLKFNDLKNSLKTLQLGDSLIDKLRQQITNESDKISLGVIANEIYADGVRIAYEASQVAVKKRPYLELAFYFAEKSKSAVLLEAISDSNAKSFAGIPDDLLEEEKNLKSAISLTAQKLAQKPSPEEEKYLRETSFSLNRAYETFIKKLEKEFPQYFNLKFNAASPSVQQLQQLTSSKTALLSYFIDDDNNRLYIFMISSRKFEITDHALPENFDKLITGLRNSLFFNEIRTYKTTATKLGDLLLPSRIPSVIRDLVILSAGRLSIIPFETLLEKKTDTDDYHSLPYLAKRFNIQYEFSAGLLLQKSSNQKQITTPSILLCAPVTFPEKNHLSELPGTESEVNEIAKLFNSKNLKATVYLKQHANESLVKENKLRNHHFIHFATHGVVDESNPELSRIYLQSTSEAEDGNLFAGEIYNLQLDANLVTLSACQTGLGKISKGEGVIGLSRALVYAGAKNIIVSFWSVADESTAELMKDFYKQLLENPGLGYSENLRKAKLNLINSKKYSAPYYWAPFILIGF